MLELDRISLSRAGEIWIEDFSLRLARGELTVLLGPGGSGKTSLMRIIAGLEAPSGGRVLLDGADITRTRVQKRNVAMVYQAFVNFPAWTVRDNIASPLKVKGAKPAQVESEVNRLAELLKLNPYLDRKPEVLSGGQQQRVAIARALAKGADIVLLDEPLANLDFKLREELLEELPRLLAGQRSVVLYAASDPAEALKLSATTVILDAGRVMQVGKAADLYRQPASLAAARALSDPPLNLARGEGGAETFAFRAHHLQPGEAGHDDLGFTATVAGSDVTGSETYVHLEAGDRAWTMLLDGVRTFEPGRQLAVRVRKTDILAFDAAGRSVAQLGL
jgi:glycerol transport system ATP-binding protein